jgi:hypothetical protein
MLGACIACSACSSAKTDLCAALGSGGGCNSSSGDTCRKALASAKTMTPACGPLLDALSACIAEDRLDCVSGNQIAANGAGTSTASLGPGGPDNFSDVAGVTVVVNDDRCDRYKRGYDACTTCPDAPGASDPNTLGIADRCASSAECASGLACVANQCTRSCQSDNDCKARAKGCVHLAQFPNVCVSFQGQMRCTISCSSGDDTSCKYYFGDRYTCSSQACVPN